MGCECKFYERICVNEKCQKPFTTTDGRKMACCRECSRDYANQKEKERRRLRVAAFTPCFAICECCGKEYWKKVANQKYCCKECNPSYKRAEPTTKKCKICGEEFVGNKNKIYCSKECSYQALLQQSRASEKERRSKPEPPKQKPATGKALAIRQGIFVSNKTDLQIAAEAEAAGMSAGKYRAMLQMKYEKEMGIGMYASK